jgi:hypothetical protein
MPAAESWWRLALLLQFMQELEQSGVEVRFQVAATETVVGEDSG